MLVPHLEERACRSGPATSVARARVSKDEDAAACWPSEPTWRENQPAAVGNDRWFALPVSGLLFTGSAATPTCRAVSARSGRRPARARRDGRALTPRRARAARRARRDGL